ncbi:hypothetical protein BH11PLA2_BH11PLA2_52950 [soil metagenome]
METNPFIVFDAELCEYILSQFRNHLPFGEKRPDVQIPKITKKTSPTPHSVQRKSRTPPPELSFVRECDYPTWLSYFIGKNQRFSDLLWPDLNAERGLTKLSDEELNTCLQIATSSPDRFRLVHLWQDSTRIYKWSIRVTGMIHKRLSRTDAERWASCCSESTERLSQKIQISEGVSVVHEWLLLLRSIKTVIDCDHSDTLSDQKSNVMGDISQPPVANATIDGKPTNGEKVAYKQYSQAMEALEKESSRRPAYKDCWQWCIDQEYPVPDSCESWARTVRRAKKYFKSNMGGNVTSRSAVRRSDM